MAGSALRRGSTFISSRRSFTAATSLIFINSPEGEVRITVFLISSIVSYSPMDRIRYSDLPNVIFPPGTFKLRTFSASTISSNVTRREFSFTGSTSTQISRSARPDTATFATPDKSEISSSNSSAMIWALSSGIVYVMSTVITGTKSPLSNVS